jgi:hypothetical protein
VQFDRRGLLFSVLNYPEVTFFSPRFPTIFDAMVMLLQTDYRMEILEVEGAAILELGR